MLAMIGTSLVVWTVAAHNDDSPTANTLPAEVSTEADGSAPQAEASEPTEASAPPITDPSPPAWVAPVPPEPAVLIGTGVAYSVSEPLASGLPSADVKPSLDFAQQVFDQLAANDWFSALSRFLFRPVGGVEGTLLPEQLQQQWAVSDRLSILLIDAVPDPNGVAYDLRVGVVANIENATTSVLCGHLYVEIAPNPKVIQLGGFAVVSQGEAPFQPEDFLAQPERIADLITKCP